MVIKKNKIKVSLIVFFCLSFTTGFSSQGDSLKTKKNKPTFYFGWGYNRDWYSKGDIHLQSDKNNDPQLIKGNYYSYDFTVIDATAHDRPNFDAIPDIANITIPQFSVRIGTYFNDKHDFGLEFNYDHAKYIVDDYQKVRVKGHINGQYFDKDTILDPTNFLHYEHSDGANFFMLSFIKRWKLAESKNLKNNIGITLKPGFGFVYPRTEVTLFGNRVNNGWKVSGVVGGVELGVRAEFLKNGYLEFTGKGGHANYINTLVQGRGNGKASNSFWFFEAILVVGYQFQLGK